MALYDPARELRRLDAAKRIEHRPAEPLGETIFDLHKQHVTRRQTKLAKLADVWCRLVPEVMQEHCALETFHRGRLTVLIDTAPHLYEFRQLMLAGLESQLLLACRGAGLKAIVLKRGRWYDDQGQARF